MIRNPASLVDVLQHWSEAAPDRSACRFLSFGAAPERSVTYRELGVHARAIGAALQDRVQRGDRVILLYPPSLEFVTAFLGCFHAGAIAVPVYPPDPGKPGRDLVKLRAIIADARPSLILSTAPIQNLVNAAGDDARDLLALPWLATDRLAITDAASWRDPGVTGDETAFLQYTSGSTGQPKGVMVGHGNLLDNVRCIQRAFEDDETSALVSWLPLYHDMGLIGNLLQPLWTGCSCVLMSPMEFLERPARWLETISRFRAHTSGGPNFAYELCVHKIAPAQRAGLDLRSWRVAFNGAEPVRRATLERFIAAFEPCGFRRETFFPCYGLAEATLIVSGSDKAAPPCFAELDTAALERGEVRASAETAAGAAPPAARDRRAYVGCGRVAPGHRIAIVDPASLARRAPHEVGEIWVAGPSIAQGYWAKPELSAQIFRAHTADGDGPYLRTGDLGFVRDGQVFITGRIKDVVIIRGRNHHPQDLELTAEQAHPALRRGCGAAFAVDGDATERLMMVFELDRAERDTPIDGIAAAVCQRIAEHHGVELHGLVLIEHGWIPKTTSGKIQRTACRLGLANGALPIVARWQRAALAPRPGPGATILAEPAAPDRASEIAAWRAAGVGERPPRIEAWLRHEVAAVLGVAACDVPPGVPLIQLGLSSLGAVELRGAIERSTGATLSLGELLQAESLAALAALIAVRDAGGPALAALPRVPASELVPSFGQQRLWLLAQLEPDSADYNECLVVRIAGPLRRDLLVQALRTIFARHDVLRTSFARTPDGPSVRIADAADVTRDLIVELDVQAAAAGARDAEALREIRALAARPFDLARPPLARAALITLGAEHHVLGLVIHHILCDAQSARILCDELVALYDAGARGSEPALPALPAQYGDLARWERDALDGAARDALIDYWRRQLAQLPTAIALPYDRAATGPRTPEAGRQHFALPAGTSAALRALAHAAGVTASAPLLAAVLALLRRYTGQDDLPIGVPVSRRARPEAAPLIGLFVNTLVVRGDTAGDPTFRELVARVGATIVAGLEHQALPFDLLVEALRPERRATQSPLFNVMFAHESAALAPRAAGGLAVTPIAFEHDTARFDLTITAGETPDGIAGALEYDAARFDAATIERMARRLTTLIAAAAAAPERRLSELPLDDAAAQPPVIRGAAAVRPAARCAHLEVAAHAAARPGAIAIVDGDAAWSYGALDARARRLARTLRDHGVGPDVIVGVCLERSCDLIVALLAVLYAGGAYLPLDPAHPDDRLRFLLDDAGAPVVVADPAIASRLGARAVLPPSAGDASAPLDDHELAAAALHHLAYAIYTSGSTGAPKGVLIEHRALAGYLATARDEFALTADDRVLQFTAPTFDVATEEIFGALTAGAALVLRDAELPTSLDAVLAACARHRLTVLDLPTAFWSHLVAELTARGQAFPAGVRLVIVGGEAVPLQAVAAWCALPGRPTLINAYGPTEATISATFWSLQPGDPAPLDRVPIGSPLRNVDAYLLDAQRRPVPAGLAGELYLGGDCLARGYLGRPALTDERFVANPFGPGRLYRTGDLARRLPDGSLAFLGRTDHQVKIRGFRIELGEVEAALAAHPGVRAAAVVCAGPPRDLALVGFAAPRPGVAPDELDPAALRRFLAARLPAPMVPARLAVLADWPVTAHGKIDRRALAALAAAPHAEPAVDAAPSSPIDDLVRGFYRELLGVDRVHAGDDFFALGGHSLLAMRLLSRIQAALGVQLPLRALFEAPTAGALARRLEDLVRDSRPAAAPRRAEPRRELARRIATLSPDKRELLTRSLHNKATTTSAAVIRARPRTSDRAPCSFPQQRLWFLHQLEPASCAYNMPGALRVTGRLDVAVLQRVLDEIDRRHESVRTTFREVDGQPVQVINPPRGLPLRLIDLQHLPEAEREPAAIALAGEEAHTPFDLAHGPLVRATLIQLAPEHHAWLWTMHHIISDGWANSVLINEVVALYGAYLEGRPSPLPELTIQYADYAIWQREYLQGAVLDEHLAYWKQQLATDLPVLGLPTDFPRPAALGDRGGFRMDSFSPDQLAALKQLCQHERVTLFVALMAAILAVLHAASGQDDIVIGTDVANRNRVETETMIGFCINQLVLRTQLAGNPSFRELLARAWKVALGAYAHQDMPFDLLVKELNPPRATNRTPLFQAKLVLQNTPTPPLRLPGVAISELLVDNHTSKFDLMFNAQEDELGVLRLGTSYNADLFKPATAERLLRHIEFTVTAMVSDPELRLDRYLQRLGEFETEYQRERQASFKDASRHRLQLNRQKEQRRAYTP